MANQPRPLRILLVGCLRYGSIEREHILGHGGVMRLERVSSWKVVFWLVTVLLLIDIPNGAEASGTESNIELANGFTGWVPSSSDIDVARFAIEPFSKGTNATFCQPKKGVIQHGSVQAQLCEEFSEYANQLFNLATEHNTINELGRDVAKKLNQTYLNLQSGDAKLFVQQFASAMVSRAIREYQANQINIEEMGKLQLSDMDFAPGVKAKLEGMKKAKTILTGFAQGFDSTFLQELINRMEFIKCGDTNVMGRMILTKNENGKWDHNREKTEEASPLSMGVFGGGGCDPAPRSLDEFLKESNFYYQWLKPNSGLETFIDPSSKKKLAKEEDTQSAAGTGPGKTSTCSLDQIERLREQLCTAYKETRNVRRQTKSSTDQIGVVNWNFSRPEKIRAKEKVCKAIKFAFRFYNGSLKAQSKDAEIGTRFYELKGPKGDITYTESKVTFGELSAYFNSIKGKCDGPKAQPGKEPSSSPRGSGQQ